ncbi:MAG: hypothetical protein EA357_09900 [Micavibrio sp.]|nr:MAG: hypothetical protein EA357_09900 [Micavibrio sp.]
MAKKVSARRKKLLIEMEHIIGNECYNASIQNWGPNGVFEGEGRDFRYPITFRNEDGEKLKKRYVDNSISTDQLMDGYYAFGANELHIMNGLNRVLSLLEEQYDLKL